jgi:hypothetical protein
VKILLCNILHHIKVEDRNSELVSDCCLTSTQQFFSSIMARTS